MVDVVVILHYFIHSIHKTVFLVLSHSCLIEVGRHLVVDVENCFTVT